MTRTIKRHFTALSMTALLAGPALAGSDGMGGDEAIVAVMLQSGRTTASVNEPAPEPHAEVLLHRAEQKHRACTADVKDLLSQAYALMFPVAEIPLGGDEAIHVVK